MVSSRRTFLAATISAMTAARLRAEGGPANIVDTHTHFYDPARPEGVPWPPKGDKTLFRTVLPPEFINLVKPHGIKGTILVEASPWLEDNQWVLDLAKNHPVILGVVGSLVPGKPEFRDHVKRFTKNPLFRGIRLRDQLLQPDDKVWLEDLKRLADADLSLDVLGDKGLISPTVALAKAVPDLRVVVDHLPIDGAQEDDVKRLAEAANVYVKVSHVLRKKEGKLIEDRAHYRPALEAIWRIFGSDRVLYGSNWPVSDLLGPYAAVFGVVRDFIAQRSEEDGERYFWKNSRAVYRWRDRQS